MNKTFFVAVAMLCGVSFSCLGGDINTLSFMGKSGEAWRFQLDALKMQPQGDDLVITPAEGAPCTLKLNQLALALFSDGSSSKVGTVADSGKPFTLYSVMGLCVGSFPSVVEARRALPAGVYVMKTDSGTSKLVLK